MAQAANGSFGVHSEVGQLRKVMVCAPGRAHQRLTPSNCDQLLFDDVLWVDNAKRDHFDFMQKMRDRGIDVVEMHSLLAETVAIPEAQEMDPRQPGGAQPGRPRAGRRDQELPGGTEAARPRGDPDRRAVDRGISRDARRRDAEARQGRRRRHRVPAAAAAQHALHARHDVLDLRRLHAQSAVLAGASRGADPHHRDLQVPSRLRRQGEGVVGRSDRGPWPRHGRGRRRDADRQGRWC